MSLGEWVRKARQARGLTLAALAQESGLTKGFISQVESGRSNPSLESLGRLAEALGVSAAELLGAGYGTTLTLVATPPGLPRVIRRRDIGSPQTPLVSLPVAAAHQVSVASVASGAVLRPAAEARSGGSAFLLVFEGEVVFSQGGRELVVGRGDTLVWETSQAYSVENRGVQQAALLLGLGVGVDQPDLIEAPDLLIMKRRAQVVGAATEGPLRLVAMRAERNSSRGR